MKNLELDFFEDLDNAKSITILLPPGDQIDDLFIETLEDLKEDVDIQFYTSNEMNKFADIVIQTKPQFMPLTIINEEIIWYDMPNLYKYYKEGDKTIRPRYELPFRIEGKQTYNLLNQFINIKNNIYINEAAFYSKSLIEFLNTKVCEYCGKPINLYKDKAKHLRVKCSNCTNLDTYLSTQLINEFFKTYNIVCPFDNGKLSARIDNYGMYIHCNEKHNIKIDDFFEFD